MKKDKPLVSKKYKLRKFPGKGGWTYAAIPEIPASSQNPFGWVRVKGFIDDYYFSNYHLMPMGNGQLFLPVKASVRKAIGKQSGDSITVVIFPDDDPVEIPGELLDCLRDEPGAHRFFYKLSDGEKKRYIDWIFSARKEDTRVARIATAINRMLKGLKWDEKEKG